MCICGERYAGDTEKERQGKSEGNKAQRPSGRESVKYPGNGRRTGKRLWAVASYGHKGLAVMMISMNSHWSIVEKGYTERKWRE